MRLQSVVLLCALGVASAATLNHHQVLKRDNPVCDDLRVGSNNGNRKVAIVIDSSGSMTSTDPNRYRIAAGKNLNDFLVSNAEASGGAKADLVTVIDFDDSAYVRYPLGDPANAAPSFDKIDQSGGTNIALGVTTAIAQLTAGGGDTDKRSAIVVFTDGEDPSTKPLVAAINNATAKGIRVSFGFLDAAVSTQPTDVLAAIRASNGVYATISVAAGAQNYINYVILNGLTYNDNPQGYNTQLLAGLAETHTISGSDTKTLKYNAANGENIAFTVGSITAGTMQGQIQMNGQSLKSFTARSSRTATNVTAPGSGEIQVLLTASGAPADSLFSVETQSNVPIKNCTVGVGAASSTELSAGGKAGVAIGTILAVALLAAAAWFAYKHLLAMKTAMPSGAELGQNTSVMNAGPGDGGANQMVEKSVMQSYYPVDPSSAAQTPGVPGSELSGPGSTNPFADPNMAHHASTMGNTAMGDPMSSASHALPGADPVNSMASAVPGGDPMSSMPSTMPGVDPSSAASGLTGADPSSVTSGLTGADPSSAASGLTSHDPLSSMGNTMLGGDPMSSMTSTMPGADPSSAASGFAGHDPVSSMANTLPGGDPMSSMTSTMPGADPSSVAGGMSGGVDPSSAASGLTGADPSSVASGLPGGDPSSAASGLSAGDPMSSAGSALHGGEAMNSMPSTHFTDPVSSMQSTPSGGDPMSSMGSSMSGGEHMSSAVSNIGPGNSVASPMSGFEGSGFDGGQQVMVHGGSTSMGAPSMGSAPGAPVGGPHMGAPPMGAPLAGAPPSLPNGMFLPIAAPLISGRTVSSNSVSREQHTGSSTNHTLGSYHSDYSQTTMVSGHSELYTSANTSELHGSVVSPPSELHSQTASSKHHHHAYLSADQACEASSCPLNAHDHACWPNTTECACNCRLQNCRAR